MMHFAGDYAAQGQRPGHKPPQGNALGQVESGSALKGRNKVCRPFRAPFFLNAIPRAMPWAGLSRTFGAADSGFAFSPASARASSAPPSGASSGGGGCGRAAAISAGSAPRSSPGTNSAARGIPRACAGRMREPGAALAQRIGSLPGAVAISSPAMTPERIPPRRSTAASGSVAVKRAPDPQL